MTPLPGQPTKEELAAQSREWFTRIQDENGVDLTLIRAMLSLSPIERLRRMDQARRDALRFREYGRRHRQQRG